MTINFHIEYQLLVSDYIEAQQLDTEKNKFSKLNLFILIYILLSLFVFTFKIDSLAFLVFGYGASANFGKLECSDYVFYTLFYLFFLLTYLDKAFPKLNPFFRWNINKKYQQNFVWQEMKRISILNRGITIVSESYRQHRQWSNIDGTVENKKLFLLYHFRNQEYTIIPKRIFSSETEIKNFRRLLDGNTD